jgi:hypothetical protein
VIEIPPDGIANGAVVRLAGATPGDKLTAKGKNKNETG